MKQVELRNAGDLRSVMLCGADGQPRQNQTCNIPLTAFENELAKHFARYDTFQPERNVIMSSYSTKRIKGAMS